MTKQTPENVFVSTQASIHLDRLRENVRSIRTRMPGIDMIGVVKANGYGHGSVAIARVLEQCGVKKLAVATVAEGVELRASGITSRITVFAPPVAECLGACAGHELEPIVDCAESLDILSRSGLSFECHVKVDTGMGRLGQGTTESIQLVRQLETSQKLKLASIWTHFSRADEPASDFTGIQFERFMDLMAALGGAPAPLHTAASAAVYTFPDSINPSLMSMARIGIALYGLLDLGSPRPAPGLRPVMEFSSRVSAIKRVPPLTPISYGSRWRSPGETLIATIAAGYADGVPRNLSGRGSVRIGDGLYPIVGAVCMDMFMVDLGRPGEKGSNVYTGDRATIFGAKSPTCFDVANQSQTITYERVCAISDRVERILVGATSA